jgi:hypothetical protein
VACWSKRRWRNFVIWLAEKWRAAVPDYALGTMFFALQRAQPNGKQTQADGVRASRNGAREDLQ